MGSYCGVLYSSCRVPERETGMVDMETSRIGRFAGGNEVVCSYYFYFPNEIWSEGIRWVRELGMRVEDLR